MYKNMNKGKKSIENSHSLYQTYQLSFTDINLNLDLNTST